MVEPFSNARYAVSPGAVKLDRHRPHNRRLRARAARALVRPHRRPDPRCDRLRRDRPGRAAAERTRPRRRLRRLPHHAARGAARARGAGRDRDPHRLAAAAPSSPSRAPSSSRPRSARCCASARRPRASWPSSACRSRPRTPPGRRAVPTPRRWPSSSTSWATWPLAPMTPPSPWPEVAALEVRFHDAVARATGNSVRAAIMSAILDALQRAFTAVPVPAGLAAARRPGPRAPRNRQRDPRRRRRRGGRGDARPRGALERPGDRALPVAHAPAVRTPGSGRNAGV